MPLSNHPCCKLPKKSWNIEDEIDTEIKWVYSCCRKDNPDNNISTALALSAMVFLSVLYDFTMIQLWKLEINLKSCWLHQARAAGIRFLTLRLCHGSLIFIHDLFIFSVLVFSRHINYNIARNWYHSVFPFSNYYYYQGEYLELWFSVWKESSPWLNIKRNSKRFWLFFIQTYIIAVNVVKIPALSACPGYVNHIRVFYHAEWFRPKISSINWITSTSGIDHEYPSLLVSKKKDDWRVTTWMDLKIGN
jgi:hypothetical protein